MRFGFHLTAVLVGGAVLLGAIAGLAGCGTQAAIAPTSAQSATTAMLQASTTSTAPSVATSDVLTDGQTTTTIPPAVNAPEPGTYLRDEIPRPIVEGWYRYDGDGWFSGESGDFFWRDGHFVNSDGSLMEIPASLKQYLHERGVDAQPTAAVTHYDAPKLEATPRDGVTLTVTASQWTQDRVAATVVISNKSGSSFSFANKDLQLFMDGTGLEETYPDMKPLEVAPGTNEFRTDVYFIVSQFDPTSSKFGYTPSAAAQ